MHNALRGGGSTLVNVVVGGTAIRPVTDAEVVANPTGIDVRLQSHIDDVSTGLFWDSSCRVSGRTIIVPRMTDQYAGNCPSIRPTEPVSRPATYAVFHTVPGVSIKGASVIESPAH